MLSLLRYQRRPLPILQILHSPLCRQGKLIQLIPLYTPLSPLATYTSYPTLTPVPTETAVDLTATLDSDVSIYVEVIAEKTVLWQIKSYNKKGYAIMRIREPRIRYERGEILQVYASGGEEDGPLYRTDGADYYYRIFDPDGQEEELYVPSWHVVIVP